MHYPMTTHSPHSSLGLPCLKPHSHSFSLGCETTSPPSGPTRFLSPITAFHPHWPSFYFKKMPRFSPLQPVLAAPPSRIFPADPKGLTVSLGSGLWCHSLIGFFSPSSSYRSFFGSKTGRAPLTSAPSPSSRLHLAFISFIPIWN